MAIKYYKLIDLLNRKGIKKSELRGLLGLGPNTIAKLSSNKNVNMEVIDKLCGLLNVQPGDLIEWVENDK